ncbi:pirin family protein [Lewinella sp. JB7]|uniref:pirin family protein n=1 Tax=Lewinella sp. JB7 TaxID=2962887 RepID=UPI0020C9EB74|nr:pirin family protein [Lewinella sp. JB7]MCP9236968.1 pirin family protein [Lewinella sp. JB7]
MTPRSVANILPAHAISMGGTTIHQPLPTQRIDQIDPFLLLHHFGPFKVAPGERDPLDVGPHPHRGFEPVTLLYSGGLRHRDSRGNTGYLRDGDVQWMTSGRGIIHSERASDEFVSRGGIMEGIQLWVNLAPEHKMVQPRYQDIKAADIPVVPLADGASMRIVAGHWGESVRGPAKVYGDLLVWQLDLPADTVVELPVPTDYNLAVYLLDGGIVSSTGFPYGARTMLHYRNDGEGVRLRGEAPLTRVLLLGGRPIGAPVVSHGPYVMNSQTEIMEAMRDYGMGKMGFYIDEEPQ